MCFVRTPLIGRRHGAADGEDPAAAAPRRYRVELIEGRGYSVMLCVEASTLGAAAREAARYAADYGYRLGRIAPDASAGGLSRRPRRPPGSPRRGGRP